MSAYVPPTRDGVSPSTVALPTGNWATMLDFLCERMPAIGRDQWLQRMQNAQVLDTSGRAIQAETPYQPHTKLYYWRALALEHPIPFEAHVVYQDEALLIADKPHFLPVTPSGRYVQETLLVRLKRQTGLTDLTPMHRLDRETAGLVAFTIQPQHRHAYQALFKDKQVRKIYEAIAPAAHHIHLPQWRRTRLVESPDQFMVMQEVDGPVNAETYIECIENRGAWAKYQLSPLTGQKHQLRVHLNALGIPIRNDQIYPTLQAPTPAHEAPDYRHPLQLLAKSLAFTDPITGASRHFESQLTLGDF